jgi:hypothetical protein
MEIDQESLTAALTESMNECPTSWIAYGPYEVSYIARRLLMEVEAISSSIAGQDGFAMSSSGLYRWIFVDADHGSAAFIIPKDGSGSELRESLVALEPALSVTPCIYGNVNDSVWFTLGAGRKVVVGAQDFLPE